MAEIVYFLCALASLLCAVLLTRSYLANRTPLLLWSSLCFALVFLNNMLLVIDLVFLGPEIDLTPFRTMLQLSGLLVLLYGLIWERA